MFDRAGLKNAAKARVSQNRWMAVLVCLVASFCGAMESNGVSFTISDTDLFELEATFPGYPSFGSPTYDPDFAPLMMIFLIVFGVVLLLAFAFQFFVANIINVGFYGWFLDYSRGANPEFDVMFSRFNHYKSTMLGMLLRDVYVFLWSLLFLIPGIIKAYAYAMVPYILYENPSLSAKQAVSMSETMMDGWKWELFKFELSFMGWNILAAFTCGILGVLYVNPYIYTAQAMLYDNIKYDAVYTRGAIDPALLNMPFSPVQPEETQPEYAQPAFAQPEAVAPEAQTAYVQPDITLPDNTTEE